MLADSGIRAVSRTEFREGGDLELDPSCDRRFNAFSARRHFLKPSLALRLDAERRAGERLNCNYPEIKNKLLLS